MKLEPIKKNIPFSKLIKNSTDNFECEKKPVGPWKSRINKYTAPLLYACSSFFFLNEVINEETTNTHQVAYEISRVEEGNVYYESVSDDPSVNQGILGGNFQADTKSEEYEVGDMLVYTYETSFWQKEMVLSDKVIIR